MHSVSHKFYSSWNGDSWWLEKSPYGELFVLRQPSISSGGSQSRLPVEEFLSRSAESPEREALASAMRDAALSAAG